MFFEKEIEYFSEKFIYHKTVFSFIKFPDDFELFKHDPKLIYVQLKHIYKPAIVGYVAKEIFLFELVSSNNETYVCHTSLEVEMFKNDGTEKEEFLKIKIEDQ